VAGLGAAADAAPATEAAIDRAKTAFLSFMIGVPKFKISVNN
jgi:hypothetical protein